MIIIPAIDLKDGVVVRYAKGQFDKKIYSDSPLNVALDWQAQGAKLIHIVDLDGAFTGEPKNLALVIEIAKNLNIPVEFGGGLRTKEAIKKVMDAGISRVILGTKAIDKNFLKDVVLEFKERIVVGLDADFDKLKINGWLKDTDITINSFIKELENVGVKTIIYTDISRDGMLSGPNIEAIDNLVKATKMSVIASGGVSSLEDIKNLNKIKGLFGVIVGKALYEQKFTLKAAIDSAS
ncbi:MAG: 1-(5-phosphoribosyl)-5-[(5-phosphoribosylamino)methylideneamino]imidazole-4-carboxamide isomerase [Candidatus Omnitrophota bacterium]